jgi:hypothetical protein
MNDGNGNGTINIRATAKPTSVEGLGGFDHVTLGKAGNMQGIVGPVTLTHFAALGNINLTLDDSNDPVSQNATMSVSNGFGIVTGLAPGTISFKAADVGLVTINDGSGGSTFTVADTVVNSRTEFGGTVINTGINASTVNVQGTTGNLLINTQGTLGLNGSAFGFDRINVGNAHSVQGIHGQLLVVTQSTKSATLEVDDSADKTARTVTLNNVSVSGLTQKPILFNESFGGIQLNIDGGSGGNTFLVQGGAALTGIRGGTGNDTVNVGSPANSLDNIHGIFAFVGQGTNDIVNLNDQGTTHSETYTLEALANGGNEMLRDDGPNFFFGFAVEGTTKHVVVNAGSGGNTFNVQETFGAAVTTLNTGIGSDLVNVQGTTGALVINGQSGADTVIVGPNTSAQAVKGDVTVTNNGNFTQLTVSDAADPNAHNVNMGVGSDGFISGLAQGTVRYKTNDVSAVLVNGPKAGSTFTVSDTANNSRSPHTIIIGGDGNDTFNVLKTTGQLTIDGSAGNDTINVGSAANTLDPIQGAVTVDGGLGGTDTLNINDQGSTTPHTYTQTATTLSRNGAADIIFSNVESLQVHKGPVVGNPPQAKNLELTQAVKVGQFAALSGQLTDPDGDSKLRLTVDWGDGSKPPSGVVGLKPFTLRHKYAKAGRYTVRVIWTDSTGQSNSQDMTITVAAA